MRKRVKDFREMRQESINLKSEIDTMILERKETRGPDSVETLEALVAKLELLNSSFA